MIKNHKILFVLIAVLVLASSGLVAFAVQPSARDLLVEALETTQAVTDGHAVAAFEFDAQGEKGSGTVEVWGKLGMGPNGEPAFRVEVLEASLGEFVGATAVTDGTTFWLYAPTQNKVLTGTSDEVAVLLADYLEGKTFDVPDHDGHTEEMPETPAEAVDKLLTYVTAERTGGESINGANALIVRLVPIPDQMPDEVRAAGGYLNVWLRSSDRAPLGIELAESAAGYARAMAATLEINQGVDDATFTFAIPEGVEVIHLADLELPEKEPVSLEEAAAAADMVLLTPTTLPESATLVDTAVVRGVIVQQYSLPAGARFTIAQGKTTDSFTPDKDGTAVTVRGVDGMAYVGEADEASHTLLTWTEGEVQFWVGGDLPLEEALSIAESLQ